MSLVLASEFLKKSEQKDIWKKIKLFLFITNIIVYVKNPMNLQKKATRTNKWVLKVYRKHEKHVKPIVFLYTRINK